MARSQPRRATRADVARKAGVSPTAVTAVVSGNCPTVSVAETTRQRILAAAEALGYKPNLLARGLKSRRSLLLAYLCREVYHRSHETMLGVQGALEETGYSIVHYSKGDTLEAESRHLELCWDRAVDGILLTPMLTPDGQTNVQQLLELVNRGVPIVQLPNDTLPEVPSVTTDLAAATRCSLDHLLQLGHRRIALLQAAEMPEMKDPTVRAHASQRLGGYEKRMQEVGLEPIVLEYPHGLQQWRYIEELIDAEPTLARMVLEHPARPTAVIAQHDHIAIALIRALTRMQRPVPETLSVVGMHNIHAGRLTMPSLTTVEMHHQRIGATAARMLYRQIEGESVATEQVQPELIVRESTSAPPPPS